MTDAKETKITREELDDWIGGVFIGEQRVRVYLHPYGREMVFDSGERLLKLNKCNSGDYEDGREVVARVIHESIVEQIKIKVAVFSSFLRLVCGEAVPAPANWESSSDVLREIRLAEATAVFDNYEVFERKPCLPAWDKGIGADEEDEGGSRSSCCDR